MLKLLWIFTIIVVANPLVGQCFQHITCTDGNLLGIQELVEVVQMTVEKCKSTTSSRVDLLSCVYKQLRMADDRNPTEKAKEFFEKVHSSKIMNEARDLVKKLKDCAETYADSFSNSAGLEENASKFRTCFLDNTNKFVDWAKSECQATKQS